MERAQIIVIGIVLCLISACSATPSATAVPTSEASATPNEVLVTPDATRMHRDLPPTWTPTPTPTITLTPTVTATFTVTPSLTPINRTQLCADFRYDVERVDGQTFDDDDTFSISYGIGSSYHYAFVGIILAHDDVEEIISDVMPGGNEYMSTFDVSALPTSGEWSYLTGVFLIDENEILCQQEGTFVIEPRAIRTQQAGNIPTAMPVPSITPVSEPTSTPCYIFCIGD